MMELAHDAVLLLFCYVIGAIPTGLLVGRALGGLDVRQHGSCNIGATNVWRVLGWKAGLLTFVTDVGKAYLALLVAWSLHATGPGVIVLAAVAVLLGNFFNVFLGWKGGKGVATGLGVFLFLAPVATALALAAFAVVFAASRIVSLSSLVAAAVLPAGVWLTGQPVDILVFTVAVSAAVIFKHRTNIQRLLTGQEHRWGKSRE